MDGGGVGAKGICHPNPSLFKHAVSLFRRAEEEHCISNVLAMIPFSFEPQNCGPFPPPTNRYPRSDTACAAGSVIARNPGSLRSAAAVFGHGSKNTRTPNRAPRCGRTLLWEIRSESLILIQFHKHSPSGGFLLIQIDLKVSTGPGIHV